jgi:hypothetical protein
MRLNAHARQLRRILSVHNVPSMPCALSPSIRQFFRYYFLFFGMSNHFDFESSDTSSTSNDSDASSDESIFELCLLSLNLASREAKYHRL